MPDLTKPKVLTLEVEIKGRCAIVKCHGKLVSGVAEVLYNQARDLMPDYPRVILDLTDLARVDSMGLGTLVRLYVHSRSVGSSLELINLGKQVRELLGMTNLLSVFTVIGEHNIKLG